MATNNSGSGGNASSKVEALLAEDPWSSPLRDRVSRLLQSGHPLEVEVALLRASCDHPEPASRAHAARLLARFPTVKRPPALPAKTDKAALAAALDSADVLERREAGERAARLDADEARELALLAIRLPEPEAWLLTGWVRLLASHATPEDADEFAALLDHRSPAVQAVALGGLAKVSPEAGPVAAQRKRRVGDPRLRAAALEILGQVSPDQVLPALLETAGHPGWWMRGAVFPLLSSLQAQDAERVAVAVLDHEEDHANLVSGLILLARLGSPASASVVQRLRLHGDTRVAQVAKNTWKSLSNRFGPQALRAAAAQEPGPPAASSPPPAPRDGADAATPLPEPRDQAAATAPLPVTPSSDEVAQAALQRLAAGDVEGAVAALQAALDEGRAALTPAARFALATAALWSGDRVAAMNHLRGLDPTGLAPPHLYCLARDLEAAGLPAEARRLHQQVEARLPGYLDAAGRALRLPVEDGGLPAAAWDALATRYDDLRPLGRGGMGSVYRARDRIRDRDVALKIPREDILAQPRVRERFLLEMEALAGLDHPNVVPILEVAGGELPHFSMELVEGRTLSQLLAEEGPLCAARTLALFRPLAAGLGHVHGHQLVHRDLKPDNILVGASGEPRITDFGLAANALRLDQEELGKAVGTLTYMAPEQLLGGDPEPPADVYSMGAILYEALIGAPPFRPSQAIDKLREPAPSLYETLPDGPAPLVELVDRCLLRDPGDRFHDGQALYEALAGLGAG